MTRRELEQTFIKITPDTFNNFLKAVKRAKDSGEVSLLDLQLCLGKLVEEARESCRAAGSKGAEMTEQDKDLITVASKTVAMYMLILFDARAFSQLSETMVLFLEYASYIVKSRFDFLGTALQASSCRVKSLGYTWTSLENASSVDVLAYYICSQSRFDQSSPLPEVTASGRGSARLGAGTLCISSAPSWEVSGKSLEMNGGKVVLETRNSRQEKLKQSDARDIAKLDEFMNTFLHSQDEAERLSRRPKNVTLKEGDTYAITITDFSELDDGYYDIKCKVLGLDDDREFILEDEELVKGTFTDTLLPFIYDNDYIIGATLVETSPHVVFSIKDTYQKFARDAAQSDYRWNTVLEARVDRIFEGESEDKSRVILVSAGGYGCLMRNYGNLKSGDTCSIKVINVQTMGSDMYINVDTAEVGTDTSVLRFVDEDVLYEKFTFSEAKATEKVLGKLVSDTPKPIPQSLRSLARILARVQDGSSMERLYCMMAACALSKLTADQENLSFSHSRLEYLKRCIAVAQRQPQRELPEGLLLSQEERSVLQALAFLDRDVETKALYPLLEACDYNSLAGKVSTIVLGSILSLKQSSDDYAIKRDAVRRQLCEMLDVADQYTSSQRDAGGKYGLGELENVEFKASYVMRNDGKGPDLEYQSRGQVFEAVCGMLNKDGGTVYVGVNNSGDPITETGYGIPGDLDWFQRNFDTVKMLKSHQMGHPVPQPKDLDTYCLFLNDERDLYFKPTLKDYITISPTEDQDAIRITVKPSQFEIAVLYKDNSWSEGCAYVRDGQETVPMTRVQQEQRLMKLRSVGKIEKFILTLTEAIDKQHKVILKGYRSSNSNKVGDRYVVPVNLACNDENLWAYDLDKKELREFRLARIEDIVTDLNNPSYPHDFTPGHADVFRWINSKVNYHIKFKLSIAALNNLREEYSGTRNLTETELYQISPERWILDTTLHGLGAARRFYLGLADQIEIMDTEDSESLKKDIREFIEKNIK